MICCGDRFQSILRKKAVSTSETELDQLMQIILFVCVELMSCRDTAQSTEQNEKKAHQMKID
jgi:hypothetical protein